MEVRDKVPAYWRGSVSHICLFLTVDGIALFNAQGLRKIFCLDREKRNGPGRDQSPVRFVLLWGGIGGIGLGWGLGLAL